MLTDYSLSLPATDIVIGPFSAPDPLKVDQARIKNGIHSEFYGIFIVALF